MTRARRGLIGLAVAFVALPAGVATAGTVNVVDGTLVIVGTTGEDQIAITRGGPPPTEGDGPTYTVFDRSNQLTTTSTRCVQTPDNANEVKCTFPQGDPGLAGYRMTGDAGNDTLTADQSTTFGGTILGGAGDDQLGGGGGNDALDGGDGNDTLRGDENYEGSGSNSRKGADDIRGGAGIDTMTYAGHDSTSIVASLDDQANDGQPGEGDNVHADVENLTGDYNGSGNTLTGSAAANQLEGASQNDTLAGGGGNDRLRSFGGNDRLDGGAGDDFLEAGFDDDVLDGGPGTDSFVGDETRSNTIGTGNDTILARDGIAEPVSCGPGADQATVDANDIVATDPQNGCETVDRGAAAPGGGGGATTPGAFPLSLGASSVKASKSGRVTIKLKCTLTGAAGCNGTLRLASAKKVKIDGKRKSFSLGSKSFSIAPGKSARVVFKLSKANRAALKKLKRVKLLATATERAAPPRKVSKTVTLRR
jgi:RTX calcium-binding nonapeptide repeat (4 copies)